MNHGLRLDVGGTRPVNIWVLIGGEISRVRLLPQQLRSAVVGPPCEPVPPLKMLEFRLTRRSY
eukprot:SAG31_NODE_608_length_13576_cov_23.757290_10_plen_63_part_00